MKHKFGVGCRFGEFELSGLRGVSTAGLWTVTCSCGHVEFVRRSYLTEWRKRFVCVCGHKPTLEPTHLVGHPHARPERRVKSISTTPMAQTMKVVSFRVPEKVWGAIVHRSGGETSPAKLFKRMVASYLQP